MSMDRDASMRMGKKGLELSARSITCLVAVIFGLLFIAGCIPIGSLGEDLPGTSQVTVGPAGVPIPVGIATTVATSEPTSGLLPGSSLPASPAPTSPTYPTPDVTPESLTRYDLEALFDYSAHTLAVTETIRYLNSTSQELTELVLVVEPNRSAGGFELTSLTWEDVLVVPAYDLKDNQLRIPLGQPLEVGERLNLTLRYQLSVPPISAASDTNRPIPYGYTVRQTNLVDWYPFVPPYLPGKGWLVHTPYKFGEHQVYDMAVFQVRLTLAEPVAHLLVAASAPAVIEGRRYTYESFYGRTFALSAGNEYLLQSTQVGEVTINSYTFPYDKYAGLEVLHNTAAALQLYSALFGPYPHTSLSVVEADFLDGMEYDGLFFLSHGFYDLYDGTPKGYLTFIAAHETAHQWWYGLVGNDQAMEPWLDEALCTYMEHVFYENVYAEYPPRSGQSLVNWWWYYRVDFYQPAGWVDSTIYDFTKYRSYRDAVYLNGAQFLEQLRNQTGDEAFFAFLRDYAHQFTGKIATSQDFFSILRKHTHADLIDLLAQYFQNPH